MMNDAKLHKMCMCVCVYVCLCFKTVFIDLSDLESFYPVLHCFLRYKGNEHVTTVPFRFENSTVSYSMHVDQLKVSVRAIIYYKMKLRC